MSTALPLAILGTFLLIGFLIELKRIRHKRRVERNYREYKDRGKMHVILPRAKEPDEFDLIDSDVDITVDLLTQLSK